MFKDKVLTAVAEIPKGQVLTYQEVATRAGRPRAYRAVGNILRNNYDPKIPCHRVIRSDGTIGGYNRGVKKKIELLKKEGFDSPPIRESLRWRKRGSLNLPLPPLHPAEWRGK